MTRVVTIDDTPEAVKTLCDKFGIGISVIEPLQSGGTRLILNNGIDAEKVRREMKTKLITGPSVRSSLYVARTRPRQT
jgi:hypothetical protein